MTSIGVRLAGTKQNEEFAVNYLLKKLKGVKNRAHTSQLVEIDHQIVSGAYKLNVFGTSINNVYRHVQNIIVKLHGSSSRNDSLMFNCHYDTVPGSPGASDDGANCAIMLEVLKVLSNEPKRLKHSIIFLFNGAEETPLQAAHGFVTQHPWAGQVRTFINLESAGSGGKEVLFQAGPQHPWLIDIYAKVPHPSAQAAAEEIFQSNLIPSDTDFRIFRDYGKVPGLDFAHSRQGYRYHTKYDNIDFISPHFMQHTGDNALVLAKIIANYDQLPKAKDLAGENKVFYDFLGFFFIHYTNSAGKIINYTVAVLAVLAPVFSWVKATSRTHFKYFLSAAMFGSFLMIISEIAAILSGIGLAILLDYFDRTMSWYAQPWLAIAVYGSISLLAILTVYSIGDLVIPKAWIPVSTSLTVQAYLEGVNIFWGLFLLAMTACGFRFGYGVMLMLLCPLIANILIIFFGLQNSKNWLLVHLGFQVPLVIWTSYIADLILGVFIPISGRSDTSNADLKIGILVCCVTLIVTSYFCPLFLLLRKRLLCLGLVFLVTISTISLICLTNFGFPYQADGPTTEPRVQRHYVTHTRRVFYDLNGDLRYQDNGFWLRELDRNSHKTIESISTPLTPYRHFDPKICRGEPFCGMPLYQLREFQRGGFWVQSQTPPLVNPTSKLRVNDVKVTGNIKVINFTLTENVLTALVIRPVENVTLIGWSLFDEPPTSTELTREQGHFISITHGLKDKLPLSVTIKLKANSNKTSGVWANILVTSHVFEQPQDFTDDFRNLLRRFPAWTFFVPSVASVIGYQI